MYRDWNFIVDQYRTNQYAQETTVQAHWEQYFSEIFGFKRIRGEIDPQRIITLGSTKQVIPDIILRKDGKDLVDIELKKYSL